MSDNSSIEWTDATWPIVTGCSIASPGCAYCYAMRLAGTRLKAHPSRAGLTAPSKAGPVWTGEVRFNEQWLTQPLRWKRPRSIFVAAHGDLFHEDVPARWIDKVFAVMALAPQHTFQILTKRAKRMRQYLAPFDSRRADALGSFVLELGYRGPLEALQWPLPNVWLGVSAEDQRRYDERKDDLRETPAAVRFFSFEPLLGPIVGDWFGDWAISGGENGPRPTLRAWTRSIRDQCAAAGVAYFHKQNGEWIDADEHFDELSKLAIFRGPDGKPFKPVRPLNYHDAAIVAGIVGAPFEHHSDGSTLIRVGRKRAGRLLDGRTHDAMPKARA